ncbi:uncharacterized protein LOC118270852 [Spodoptera frugiperda]|uniref:Uncharacterized protein LOC118270852 n=1 Tax=Spodoptera frugiperda TaxID=7108 RepID=A0A9R0DVE5_SPOFR|nr:uncharacterized protein LOC118270852 [Spodoptera frugiperda]
MLLIFMIFIAIPLVTSRPYFDDDVISYRSSVMENDKPILRMPAVSESEENEEDSDRSETKSIEYTESRESEGPVKDLTLLVQWLLDNLRYDAPQSRKDNGWPGTTMLIDAEPSPIKQNHNNIYDLMEPRIKIPVLHAQPDEEVKIETTTQPAEPEVTTPPSIITMTKLKKKVNPEPFWVTDLRDFIKDLTTKFGQEDIAQYTKPVIASLEKKHHVQITDIDLDQYGEIFIHYVPKKSSNKRERPESRAVRYKTKKEGTKTKINFLNSR